MGNNESKQKPGLSDEEATRISKQTHFSPDEVKILYKRFLLIESTHIVDQQIDITEFQTALGLVSKGFALRIFTAFDKNGSKNITFDEFTHCLSVLCPKASLSEKATFCFEIYDNDKNGTISRQELKEVLEFSLAESNSVHVSPQQIDQIVDQTFKQVDSDNSGGITLQEFLKAANNNPSILNCVTLNYDTLMTEP
ncbi:Calcineurin B-like protein 2 [Tritrichomonas foetus]|uniref:Calcineurin B-like protein 2 n=1 Tax=Tritrichomonas foetus TaxID=1144522 RepID=A0A1J4JYW0_9EUKA|nr:Calcineurin B-like protein 2 [Tritrichomonas foetus]|eukprot:OHT02453.1 Calcineurin B-like protein 2 [Tritrichomonas foetus]